MACVQQQVDYLHASSSASAKIPTANQQQPQTVTSLSPWYIHGSRRYVLPYYFTFQVFAKGRWVGRSLVDVFSAEFKHHPREYYERAVAEGRLWISSKTAKDMAAGAMPEESPVVPTAADVSPPLGGEGSSQQNTGDGDQAAGVIVGGSVISHTVHKHELSVLSNAVVKIERFLLESELLVVTKPASVPTHPSGRYHLNSVVMMLEYVLSPGRVDRWLDDGLYAEIVDCRGLSSAEREQLRQYYSPTTSAAAAGKNNSNGSNNCDAQLQAEQQVTPEKKPRSCHRLDKTTSGVVIFAVSASAAKQVGNHLAKKSLDVEIAVRRIRHAVVEKSTTPAALAALLVRSIPSFGVRKKYVARVCGRFPEKVVFDDEVVAVEGGVLILKSLGTGLVKKRGRIDGGSGGNNEGDGDADDESWQQKLHQNQDAATFVQVVSYDDVSNESIVECCPMTGRTHQIRIHLSMVGHPITNDVLYNPQYIAPTDKLYFDATDLPPAVRDQFQRDEMCAECKGEIPVTTVGDEGSQVFLHAAEYEVTLENGRRETFSSTLPTWTNVRKSDGESDRTGV